MDAFPHFLKTWKSRCNISEFCRITPLSVPHRTSAVTRFLACREFKVQVIIVSCTKTCTPLKFIPRPIARRENITSVTGYEMQTNLVGSLWFIRTNLRSSKSYKLTLRYNSCLKIKRSFSCLIFCFIDVLANTGQLACSALLFSQLTEVYMQLVIHSFDLLNQGNVYKDASLQGKSKMSSSISFLLKHCEREE